MKALHSLIYCSAIPLMLAADVVVASHINVESNIQEGANLVTAQNQNVKLAGADNIYLAAVNYKAGVNKVNFTSEGVKMVGDLYLPPNYKPGEKLPVVIVTGSWTSVKEQMAGLYAKKLGEQGFAALAFDFRYWGESGGEPRQYESPNAKIQDIKNAVTYLQSLPMIDANRIGGLGVCASAGYMAHAVAEDSRIRSFATVAAWLQEPESVRTVYGGEEAVRKKIETGLAARRKYEKTGKVDYVPAFEQDNPNAAMSGEPLYYGNPKRGSISEWKNRFAVMSWAEWLQFDAIAAAPKVNVPTLFVHSENAALPDGVRKFYNTMPGKKKVIWAQGQQFDFYDREPYVNKAVEAVTSHFKNTLIDAKVSQK